MRLRPPISAGRASSTVDDGLGAGELDRHQGQVGDGGGREDRHRRGPGRQHQRPLADGDRCGAQQQPQQRGGQAGRERGAPPGRRERVGEPGELPEHRDRDRRRERQPGQVEHDPGRWLSPERDQPGAGTQDLRQEQRLRPQRVQPQDERDLAQRDRVGIAPEADAEARHLGQVEGDDERPPGVAKVQRRGGVEVLDHVAPELDSGGEQGQVAEPEGIGADRAADAQPPVEDGRRGRRAARR